MLGRSLFILLVTQVLIFVNLSIAGERETTIVDPPYYSEAVDFSKRVSGASFIGIAKIFRGEELVVNKNSCGYVFSVEVAEEYTNSHQPKEFSFVSFDPQRFIIGEYYLIYFDDFFKAKNIFGKESDSEGLIGVVGSFEQVKLSECGLYSQEFYADNRNAFPITPSPYGNKFTKRVIINSLFNRFSSELKNDTTGESPCDEGEASHRQCIELSSMRRYILNIIKSTKSHKVKAAGA